MKNEQKNIPFPNMSNETRQGVQADMPEHVWRWTRNPDGSYAVSRNGKPWAWFRNLALAANWTMAHPEALDDAVMTTDVEPVIMQNIQYLTS